MTNEKWLVRPAAMLAIALLAGCTDDLPTVGGDQRFPGGSAPTTVEILLTRSDVFVSDAVFDDFADPRDAPYLLMAEDFDGALDAHALTRFREFPQAVTYSVDGASRTDSVFEYVSGRLTAVVRADATAGGTATLRLFELAEPWDSASVTWESRSEGEPWAVPGGTPGELLAEAIWVRGDTVAADTVAWDLDPATVNLLATEGAAGVMVTSALPGSRVQTGALRLQVTVRPESTPDTTITLDIGGGARNFVFTPPPPAPDGIYRVSGITAARTVFTLDLTTDVPGCSTDPLACPTVALEDVTINLAELVLEPLPVTSGFRPLNTSALLIRRLAEPELGRLAPLGEALVSDTVPAVLFDGSDDGPLRLNLTTAVRRAVQTDTDELAFSLLGETTGGQFGYQWYAANPVLRVIYTLPNTPRLP